jgi:hypothetical protein
MTVARVPFRLVSEEGYIFRYEEDVDARQLDATATEVDAVGEGPYMSAETARRFHTGKLADAEVIAEVLGRHGHQWQG